jgi:glutamate racemase
MPRDNRPIGIFDSGIGGLTVVREMERRLPHERILYLGDTARVPYGTKTPQTVTRYADQIVRWLLDQEIKLLVVACNTASALALPALRERYSEEEGIGGLGQIQGKRAHVSSPSRPRIPVVGVIEPGAAAALAVSRGGRIGVIGTEGTIADGAYERAIAAHRPGAQIISAACPLFVALAEEGWVDDDVAQRVAEIYLAPVRDSAIDTLILGCTHYPLLRGVIGQVMGPDVALVDSGPGTADEVARVLDAQGLAAPADGDGGTRFRATDNPVRFRRVGSRFLCREIGAVEVVDL